MRKKVSMFLSMTCAAALVVLTGGFAATAQGQELIPPSGEPKLPGGLPLYNPYPPDIIPPDILDGTEIARVRREVQGIFNKTLAASHALPPPNLEANRQPFRAADIY